MMQPNADVSKMDEATWSKTFAGLVDGISSEVTYEESAQTLRDLVKGGGLGTGRKCSQFASINFH